MWRNCIDVTDPTYGATGDGTTNDLAAIDLAVAAARSSGLPLYFPSGTYLVEFERGLNEAGGRFLVDWERAEIFGDGPGRSKIVARSIRTSGGRRASMIDSTVARGVVQSVGAGGVTLTVPADAGNFRAGDAVYFADNSDGTSRRAKTAAHTRNQVISRNVTTGEVFVSSMSEISGVQVGDYVFVEFKVFLQTAGDHANFSAGMGVYPGPSSDGSGLRSTENGNPIYVMSVDSTNNAITLDLTNDCPAFADGDYLFRRCDFALFHHPLASTSGDWGLTVRDLSLVGESYGFDETDARSDIRTYGYFRGPALSGLSVDHRVRFENVECSEFATGVTITAGAGAARPALTLEVERCDFHDALNNHLVFFVAPENQTCHLVVRDSKFVRTSYTHAWYVHPNISLLADACRFDDIGTLRSAEAIDHWGQYNVAARVSVTNCEFGPGISRYPILTGTNGDILIQGNTFQSRKGIAARNNMAIIGNTFRPVVDSASLTTCIESYSPAMYNGMIRVIGNLFDFTGVIGAGGARGVDVELPGRWIIDGNTFTCSTREGGNYNPGDNGPEPNSRSLTCLTVANAIHNGASAVVEFTNNLCFFDPSTGDQFLAGLSSVVPIRLAGNRYVGQCGHSYGAINAYGVGLVAGTALWVIEDNHIEVTRGAGISFQPRLDAAAALSVRIRGNDIVTHPINSAGLIDEGHGVEFLATFTSTGALACEISDNRFTIGHADSKAIFMTAAGAPAAGKLRGQGNTGCEGLTFVTNGQNFSPPHSLAPASVSAASSTGISADHDSHVLTAASPVTVDTLLVNGQAAAQLGFDGASVTLAFADGNVTLGAAGNLTAAGGARAAGSACRLQYFASLGKWVEL